MLDYGVFITTKYLEPWYDIGFKGQVTLCKICLATHNDNSVFILDWGVYI